MGNKSQARVSLAYQISKSFEAGKKASQSLLPKTSHPHSPLLQTIQPKRVFPSSLVGNSMEKAQRVQAEVSQFQAVSPGQLQALPLRQGFPPGQFQVLPAVEMKALSPGEFQVLPPGDLQVLSPIDFKAVPTGKFQSLSPGQYSVSPEQLPSLGMFHALPPIKFQALGCGQVTLPYQQISIIPSLSPGLPSASSCKTQ